MGHYRLLVKFKLESICLLLFCFNFNPLGDAGYSYTCNLQFTRNKHRDKNKKRWPPRKIPWFCPCPWPPACNSEHFPLCHGLIVDYHLYFFLFCFFFLKMEKSNYHWQLKKGSCSSFYQTIYYRRNKWQ